MLEEYRRLDRGGRPRRSYKEASERSCAEYLPTSKPASQNRYRQSFENLSPQIDDLHRDEITKGRLADPVTARGRVGIEGAAIRRDLAALGVPCSLAVAVDTIETHSLKPFSKRHTREGVPRANDPAEAEIEALVERAPPTMGRVIRLLAETGMRLTEALSSEWSRGSLHRGAIRLTKTSAPGTIPLCEAALRHSRRHTPTPDLAVRARAFGRCAAPPIFWPCPATRKAGGVQASVP